MLKKEPGNFADSGRSDIMLQRWTDISRLSEAAKKPAAATRSNNRITEWKLGQHRTPLGSNLDSCGCGCGCG